MIFVITLNSETVFLYLSAICVNIVSELDREGAARGPGHVNIVIIYIIDECYVRAVSACVVCVCVGQRQ